MMFVMRVCSLFAVFLYLIPPLYASDLAREQRMASEIVDSLLDGDVVYLQAESHNYLAIYTEAEDARGTVIILHGRGFHPDWPDAISPLRVGLVDSGWNTLSVQMPVLNKQAKYYDYVPLFPEAAARIDAAIAYVREQDENAKVILAAHSCGAHMAMYWLDTEPFEHIDAYIGIGMGATDYKQPMKKDFPLQKLTVPVLDVYAENDYPSVLKLSEKRWSHISQAGNEKSAQMVVAKANHYYVDRGEALTAVISRWLDTL